MEFNNRLTTFLVVLLLPLAANADWFDEIRDGEAIYYIGDFRITNQETLNFDIEVTPEGESAPYKAQLSQQFYID